MRSFERERRSAEFPCEVEIAIWFHDTVYDTSKNDNEEQSAAWAESYLAERNAPADAVGRIVALILATKSHENLERLDERLMMDVDLGILGQPPPVFEAYDAAIRREYAWVPEDRYRRGRAAVLESFLKREAIFHTENYRDAYEAQARRNLVSKVDELRGDD